MSDPDDELSFEYQLLTGFAELAAENPDAVESLTWRDPKTKTVYAKGEIGIYLEVYPEVADTTVTLAEYTVSDDTSLSDSIVGVQVTIRSADRYKLARIRNDLFNLFHGRHGGKIGTVTLISAVRSSGTNVGQDTSDRLGRLENYYLTVHRPSPHRY